MFCLSFNLMEKELSILLEPSQLKSSDFSQQDFVSDVYVQHLLKNFKESKKNLEIGIQIIEKTIQKKV